MEHGDDFELESACESRKRVILHVDIDCFYAQVEIKKNPILATKPVGIQQKNIVVTSNYLARSKGVGKCVSIHDALKACPDLVLVNGEDLAEYREASQQIFDLLCESGCNVEKLGMDENFLDVTDLVQDRIADNDSEKSVIGHVFGNYQNSCMGSVVDMLCLCHKRLIVGSIIAKELRQKVFEELGISSSCGIAHNKLLAKLVGSQFKPNDQTVLYHESQMELMNSLPSIKCIPGLGSATYDLFRKKGITSISELQNASVSSLSSLIQDPQKFINLSLGIDNTIVKMNGRPKSIGLEDRFPGISSKEGCIEKIRWLLNRLSQLVLKDGRQGQTLKVFIRDADKDKNEPSRKFVKYSRQSKVSPSSFSSEQSILGLEPILIQLIGKMIDFNSHFHLTLIGISVTDFCEIEKNGIEKFLAKKRNLEDAHAIDDQKKRKKNETNNIPSEWDSEVFNNLPQEIQKELLATHQHETPPLPKKTKSNSILKYFHKKE